MTEWENGETTSKPPALRRLKTDVMIEWENGEMTSKPRASRDAKAN